MERAGKILKDFLSNYNVEGGRSYSTLYRSWDQLAGSPLADHVQVKDLKGNQLLIEIDHPGWFQLFKFQEKQILGKLQKSYPELDIKAFKVRVVPRAAAEEESSGETGRDGRTTGRTVETGEQPEQASIESSSSLLPAEKSSQRL